MCVCWRCPPWINFITKLASTRTYISRVCVAASGYLAVLSFPHASLSTFSSCSIFFFCLFVCVFVWFYILWNNFRYALILTDVGEGSITKAATLFAFSVVSQRPNGHTFHNSVTTSRGSAYRDTAHCLRTYHYNGKKKYADGLFIYYSRSITPTTSNLGSQLFLTAAALTVCTSPVISLFTLDLFSLFCFHETADFHLCFFFLYYCLLSHACASDTPRSSLVFLFSNPFSFHFY